MDIQSVIREGRLAYTIGKTDLYSQYIASQGRPVKLGRTRSYAGGAVFRTRADADAYVTRHPGYSVYGVILPDVWTRCVDDCDHSLTVYGAPCLLVDSEIIDLSAELVDKK